MKNIIDWIVENDMIVICIVCAILMISGIIFILNT